MEGLGDFVAGGLGGVSCVLAGQPFDTIKVKLQTYPHLYRSLFHAITKTASEEKFRGFYAGTTPSLMAAILENAVLFIVYGNCKKIIQLTVGAENLSDLTVHQMGTAGAMSAIVCGFVIAPLERIKCMLQAQIGTQVHDILKGKKSVTGVSDVNGIRPAKIGTVGTVRQVLHQEGLFAMWKGLTGMWIRMVPGYYVYFLSYTGTRKLLTPKGQHELSSPWRVALAGGMAGSIMWGVINPADVVKSRIQVRSEYSGSFFSALVKIVSKEGIFALYKGVVPAMLRAFPANGALLVTFEYTRLLFHRDEELDQTLKS